MRLIQWHLKNNWRLSESLENVITIPRSLHKIVAGGNQCASRSTIIPTKTCSANLYRWMKRRVRCSNEQTARGTWSLLETSYKLSETKGGLSGPKRVQELCLNNTTVVAYINKERGMKSGSRCALLLRILTW